MSFVHVFAWCARVGAVRDRPRCVPPGLAGTVGVVGVVGTAGMVGTVGRARRSRFGEQDEGSAR